MICGMNCTGLLILRLKWEEDVAGYEVIPSPDPLPTEAGRQFTLSLRPPLPIDCRFELYINNTRTKPGEAVGGLKAVGLGAKGTASLEIVKSNPNAEVTIAVKCPGDIESTYASLMLGKGWHQPADPPSPPRGPEPPPPFDADFPPSLQPRRP